MELTGAALEPGAQNPPGPLGRPPTSSHQQMNLAILSDTHMPRGARRLPQACVDRLECCELIIHAGDFVTSAVLHELQAIAPVHAVHGNVDDAGLRGLLPERRTIELGPLRVGLIHDAGPRRGRLTRLRRVFPDVDAVVFGHSHIPLHERAPDGFQIFNPGSPTERRRAPTHTMGIATVGSHAIEFELVSLG